MGLACEPKNGSTMRHVIPPISILRHVSSRETSSLISFCLQFTDLLLLFSLVFLTRRLAGFYDNLLGIYVYLLVHDMKSIKFSALKMVTQTDYPSSNDIISFTLSTRKPHWYNLSIYLKYTTIYISYFYFHYQFFLKNLLILSHKKQNRTYVYKNYTT